MNYEIDEQYLTDVVIHREWNYYGEKTDPTPDDIVRMLRGEGHCSSTESIDHPEFTRLRNQLEEEGYIEVERRWWNGDRVLQSFTLNGYKFELGDKFLCASAMKFHLKYGV